ncbi:MAG: glycyl-radical enzyme activating protein [Clostridiales bacterium]|nr:glycyl-radical enzyme activating protein [Clostridiales bacterium]
MKEAIVFSIEEFSVYDGPGIRTTVFFKGCPMRCNWCHNPEGLSPKTQIVKSPNGCLHCGACERVCTHKEGCVACGNCISVCPRGLIRYSGVPYTTEQLFKKLKKNSDYLKMAGGGVTFSGGECMLYADFLHELIPMLKEIGVHTAIQTSGYASEENFLKVISVVDYVMFDLKVMDEERAIEYTGRSNVPILKNFELLKKSGVPFMVRTPLIPGVTDTEENLTAIAERVKNSGALGIELLPYNKMSGSKYTMAGMEYHPKFDEQQEVNADVDLFLRYGIKAKIM